MEHLHELDGKRSRNHQPPANLVHHFRWFCSFAGGEKEITRLMKLDIFYWSEEMFGYENSVVRALQETRKVEIRFDRVAAWTLIFTNAFFVSYFFAKLIQLI